MATIQNNLTRRYVVALLLIAVLATIKLVAGQASWRTLDSFGEAINVSGRQRMLSQKIALYAEQLADQETKVGAQASIRLSDALKTFIASHERLVAESGEHAIGGNRSYDVEKLYFDSGYGVDRQVRHYHQNGMLVLDGDEASAASALLAIRQAVEPLLRDLNAVVDAYEADMGARLETIHAISYWAYGITLLLLIGEGLLIFRPAKQMIDDALSSLNQEIKEKDDANELLKLTLNNIDQGIVVFDEEHNLLLWSRGFRELLEIPKGWFDKPRTASDLVALNRAREELNDQETSFFNQIASYRQLKADDRTTHDGLERRYLKRRPNGMSLDVVGRVLECGRVLSSYTDVTNEEASRRKIEELAWTDPLTGLNNRNSLRATLARITQAAARSGSKIAVALLDLDHFKPINDTYGHDAGDTVLRVVGERIRKMLRGNDTAFRLGGDEFAAIIDCGVDCSSVQIVMKRLVEAISQPIEYEGKTLGVGVSAGAATYPDNELQIDELVRKADTALYEAKNAGRGCYRNYDKQVDEKARSLRQIEDELRIGLKRGELALFYQGKRRVADAALIGAEALVRWRHPERGLVSPADFITVVEKSDLVYPVGAWVMQRAWRTANDWIEAGGESSFSMGVNVSARQFFDPDFVALLRELAATRPELTAAIDLEITEEIMIGDANNAASIMHELKAMGYSLSMDDFGTGYSSISYLHKLPVSTLKIDRSFLKSVTSSMNSEKIVRAIVDLGKNLGMTTLAEGVETRAQHSLLIDAGCDQMQGFLFDRPIEKDRFERDYLNTQSEALSA